MHKHKSDIKVKAGLLVKYLNTLYEPDSIMKSIQGIIVEIITQNDSTIIVIQAAYWLKLQSTILRLEKNVNLTTKPR